MSFIKSIKNAFGLDIERPKYEVIKTLGDNMEIRKYAPTKWVSTTMEGEADHYKSDYQTKMFYKLFNYISGENENKEKISMTSPVTVAYNSSDMIAPTSQVKMTMGFFVPIEKKDGTPVPSSSDTFLREEPEMTVAVIKFGGYPTTDDYLKQRDLLINTLGDDAKNYDTVNMMTAGYDPPFKPIKRTNEIWLKKIH
ncbi:heme-binding 2 [Brachionus plicatilis]|uniref:Heme-binding 2 n=1 Tax=Brachionus plicatilis TaxID=10195 RepID=A0A3M7T3R2_BRAPC|nr:heme-binding 2 [Brachionus plicatilis]